MDRPGGLSYSGRMLVQPVIERELRVQARARGTFWLRVLAGGAAAATLGLALLSEERMAFIGRRSYGPHLFALLHTAISVVLAVACPLISADTLARERREGTLGLLLLTPLRPASIVLGKMAVHLVRAFTMWLAIVPVLVVPLLLGGIGLVDVGFALALELGVVLGSLAAGITASSLSENSGCATALAILLAFLVGEALALLSFIGLLPFLLAQQWSDYRRHLWIVAVFGPWIFGTGLVENGFNGMLARSPAWLRGGLWTSLGAVTLGSIVLFWTAFWFASARVRGTGRERVLSASQEARRRFWFQPRWTRGQGRRLGRRLDRNPMRWLYTFQPVSRLGRWGWSAPVLLVWLGVFALGYEDDDWAPLVLGLPMALVVGLAFVSAGSFRREMEAGTFELLLVTPLRPAAILRARLITLWRDFLPALTMATGLAAIWATQSRLSLEGLVTMLAAWSSFLAVPVIGSRLAVRRVSILVGWVWTLGLAAALPGLFGMVAAFATEASGSSEVPPFSLRFLSGFILMQGAMAGLCAWAIVNDLTTRKFQLKALQRAVA